MFVFSFDPIAKEKKSMELISMTFQKRGMSE